MRAAAWRHLRVKEARRSRKVPFNRSIKAVLNWVHPFVFNRSSFAFSFVPLVSFLVISTTRFFFVCLMTVAIHRSGQASKQHLPGPACFFTFSRNARSILFG